MALAQMLPLVREWAEWVSLQKEVREDEKALLTSRADLRHFGAELKDFADTAALVELMDVVVTIDTSVANLAGAMGKVVWILLPYDPHDWRWMLDREDSVWYPTARLFRQPAAGDWASVVRRVDEELVRQFGAR
jgi:ADP-heptose:LPS heptosyltransferase